MSMRLAAMARREWKARRWALRLAACAALAAVLAGACAPVAGPPAPGPEAAAPAAPAWPWDPDVRDVRELPQDLAAYLVAPADPAGPAGPADEAAPANPTVRDTSEDWVFTPEEHAALAVDFEARHFAPWTWTATSYANATEALWGVEKYVGKPGWGENLRVLPSDHAEELARYAHPEAFPSMNRRAVVLAPAALRVLPTARPFFGDPARAGEGFPFDYFQNSGLWPGTPVLVTHATEDGAWLFAEAGHVSGWLRPGEVAWVDDDFVRAFRTGRYAVVLEDGTPLTDFSGTFRTRAHLGTLLPLDGAPDAYGMTVLVPAADADRRAVLRRASLARGAGAPWPLPPMRRVLAVVGDRMMGQPYGWGGLYENRDCSALLRDLFACVGVWLPRNSAQQAQKAGVLVDVAALAPADKERELLERGVPWRTLVWLRGHIMLYVGARNGRPVVFHDAWGVRVTDAGGREGRRIIGKAVVTTLTPGAEVPGASDLRERILGLTFLAAPPITPGIGGAPADAHVAPGNAAAPAPVAPASANTPTRP
ncbi:MAG: SH3 domain-containing protein [Desulfovibrionaceae bacterium]|jgi:hypothetical protein|nr:SH3 domain-containing protein [Desulfovibrionaceae bacterium]